MAPETVDPIDLSHSPPSWEVSPELHVFHSVNAAYKSQDLLHQPGLEHASTGMPEKRTTCAATQGVKLRVLHVASVKFRVLHVASVKLRLLHVASVKLRVLHVPRVKLPVLQVARVKLRCCRRMGLTSRESPR